MRAAARRGFAAAERALERLAGSRPRLALAAAGELGRLRNRISRRWPAPAQVRALFPDLDRRAAARIAWRIGSLEARNRLWVACLRRGGGEPLRRLVRLPAAGLEGLRPPLVLATYHVGATHALGPALERLPGRVLALRQGPFTSYRAPLEVVDTAVGAQGRAASLWRALRHLEAGGYVALAVDLPPAAAALQVRCLGRALELARGPFALARLASVPMVPIVARWRGAQVEVAAGRFPPGPATATAGEAPLAAAAASWLEEYLRASPAELGLGLLRRLLGRDAVSDSLPGAGR